MTRQSQLRPELGGEPPHQKMPLQAEVTATEHMDLLQKLKDPQVLKDLTEDAVVWATQHGLVRIVWVGGGGDRSHTVLLWRSWQAPHGSRIVYAWSCSRLATAKDCMCFT